MSVIKKIIVVLISVIIRGYQLVISPILPAACRFYPSCSEYARQAFLKHGFFKGLKLSCIRLAKCHPYHPGGVDHVP